MFRRCMSTTVLLGASLVAPMLAHSMPVLISPSNVYSLKSGVVDIRTTSFSRYRGYSPTLRSVAASVFGAPRPSSRAAAHAKPAATASPIVMTDLMRTTMPASTARSGAAVTMTIGGVRWSAGYFWGQLTLPPLSYLGEASGGNPPASNDGSDGSRDGSPAGDQPTSPPLEEPTSPPVAELPSTAVEELISAGETGGDLGNSPIVTSNIPVTSPTTASVPEPGPLGLLSAGLLGLLVLRRKQFG